MNLRSLLWGLLIAGCLAVPRARAEDSLPRWSHLELPTYPALLRNLKIGGHVKLVLTLTSEGRVKQATVRGGNPMLAELSCLAARKWVHAGIVPENKIEVDLLFDPSSGVVLGAE
jgi:hypothetical protein